MAPTETADANYMKSVLEKCTCGGLQSGGEIFSLSSCFGSRHFICTHSNSTEILRFTTAARNDVSAVNVIEWNRRQSVLE